MSDSSENVQATNILTRQSTRHGKQCLSLQRLCHGSPRPAWRRFSWSRDGGYLQTKGRRVPSFSCSGFRHRGMVMPFVLTLWRGFSPAEWGAAKRPSSYAQLDGEHSSHQHVPPAVQCQVIRPGKAAITVRALEWLHSRVFAVMPCQFVRASELPGAAFPGTLVGFLSWKKKGHTLLVLRHFPIITKPALCVGKLLLSAGFPCGHPWWGNLTIPPAGWGSVGSGVRGRGMFHLVSPVVTSHLAG